MRYLPLSADDREDMLAQIEVETIDDLFVDAPRDALLKAPLDLPMRKSELEVERLLGALAAKNVAASEKPFFVGAGAYKHHVPASVDHLIQRVGIPDQLHALPAGNLAGHPAGPVRVPDPGRQPDRHGGRQRLDV